MSKTFFETIIRIIFIGTDVTDQVANVVVAQLLFLKMEDPKKDINLYINSAGGHITSGLAILDTMLFLGCDINTYCIGQAVSMAALLLAAGSKGKRFALPHSRIMLHQPYGGVGGQVSDIEIQANEILRNRQMLNEILAKHTGKDVEALAKDTDRDFFLTSEQAKAYGLVDDILTKPPVEEEDKDKP